MDTDTENHITREIEKLAIMVAEGFAKTVTKDEVNTLRDEMNTRFDKVDERLDDIDTRLSRIEFQHEHRIELLEDSVLDLKAHAGIR